MQNRSRISLGLSVVAAALLIFTSRGAASTAAAASSPAGPATCVFSNPAFAGKCSQTTNVPAGSSAQQACESILRCLNDTGCLKTYCQATTIRSGWKIESVQTGGATPKR